VIRRSAPKRDAHATDASDYGATLDASFFAEPSLRTRDSTGIQPHPLSPAQKRALKCCLSLLRRAAKIDRSAAHEYSAVIGRYSGVPDAGS
jgi:hypothetical protein